MNNGFVYFIQDEETGNIDISSSRYNHEERLKDFQTGNSNELAKKINYYYHNKKKLRKKIDYAYNNLNRFDFNNNLKKYFRVITDLF